MSAPLVQEWVDKAEADYPGAHALQRQRQHLLPDLVCFHCHKTIVPKLQAIFDGNRDPALVADPTLYYLDTAELLLLLKTLGEA